LGSQGDLPWRGLPLGDLPWGDLLRGDLPRGDLLNRTLLTSGLGLYSCFSTNSFFIRMNSNR